MKKVFLLIILIASGITSNAQIEESPFRLFGYFQVNFGHQHYRDGNALGNSFSVQQLNIFVQRDLAKDWTAFINLEFLNNYSSGKQWGSFNLEEAWVKYRLEKYLNIKVGLQIPIFNNFNEIKNRTPLIPYIIRPIVYETSFNEFLSIEEFVPARTFLQAYGFFPLGELKFDYALNVGNSSNINSDKANGSTGVDTTNYMMYGGRVGIRYDELKAGFSSTYERTKEFKPFTTFLNLPSGSLDKVDRIRFGSDLSYHFSNFSFEAEYIRVMYNESAPDFDLNRYFFYGTLGYNITEDLFGYISYWQSKEDLETKIQSPLNLNLVIKIPNFGFSYDFNDRITFKVHFARVLINIDDSRHQDSNYYAAAVSIFF